MSPGGAELGSAFADALPELGAAWEAARPEDPALLVLNEPLARELGIDPAWLRTEPGIRLLLGNELPPGAKPVAQAYAGHQFGAYSPRLGDGRALLLGEIRDPSGSLHDLHLKGSGPTIFSRGGDGYAAVGPMLREYLMGEAMHALGIPTTRALAVIGTGRRVVRDEGYSVFPGAVLARIASSHLRVGTFQYTRARGDLELLGRLADFAIERHYPGLAERPDRYRGLLDAVISAQADLVASWMLIGFVHGVMNTDNMTISGETIDYGPCAFIDAFDPAAVFSSIDSGGRYAYGNQPNIALWNLTRFAEALLPLLSEDVEQAKKIAVASLEAFGELHRSAWSAGMRAKLGLDRAGVSEDEAAEIAGGLLGDLSEHRIDYTGAFRALAEAARGEAGSFLANFGEGSSPGDWYAEWSAHGPDPHAMDLVNPIYIPRNHLVDEALDAATEGDLAPFERILDAVSHPFEKRPGLERYSLPAPPGSRPHVTYCGT